MADVYCCNCVHQRLCVDTAAHHDDTAHNTDNELPKRCTPKMMTYAVPTAFITTPPPRASSSTNRHRPRTQLPATTWHTHPVSVPCRLRQSEFVPSTRSQLPSSHSDAPAFRTAADPFCWPSLSAREDGKQDPDLNRPRKRVQHNDSKPGAIGLGDAADPADDPAIRPNISLQQRWRKLVETMLRTKQQSAQQQSNTDRNDDEGSDDETTPASDDAAQMPRRAGGIFELYKPPTQSKRSGDKKQWFKPPWSRDVAESAEKDTEDNSANQSDGSGGSSLDSSLNSDASSPQRTADTEVISPENEPWFVPPWKRGAKDTNAGASAVNVQDAESDDPNRDSNSSTGTNLSPSDSTRNSLKNKRNTKTTPLGKIKITLPTKKSWFHWPGTVRRDENETDGQGDLKTNGPTNEQNVDTNLPGKSSEDPVSASTEKVTDVTTRIPSLAEDATNKDSKGKQGKSDKELVGAGKQGTNGGATSDFHPTVESYSIPQRDISRIRQIFGSETFFATDTIPAPGGLLFHGNLRGEPEVAVNKLEERLQSRFGDKYTLCLAEGEDQGPVVVVVPTSYHQLSAAPRHRLLALGLAMMTISTCLSRGLMTNILRPRVLAAYGAPPSATILQRLVFSPLGGTVTITVAIGLLVFLSQVVARRIVASRYRTKLAMPFMLPSYQLGSFGAVVYLVSPAPSRAALFDIAISGAVAMVVPAMICLIIGLRLSTSFTSVFPVPMNIVSGSLLMGFLTRFVPNGQILMDYQRSLIGLHPLAIIGANCLTIAALNLLPIRQLDGSRIIAALFGRRAAVKAWRMAVLYVLFASSKNPFLIMFLLIVSFGPWQVDRPSRNELTEPDNIRTIIGYLFMLLMIGLLLPYPKSSFFGTL